jgi:hypothetical protein
MTRSRALRLRLLIALAVAGCGGERAQLAPAPGARNPPGEPQAAVAEVHGLRVTLHEVPWPGTEPIARDVTPVQVTLQNLGERPLRVQYQGLSLVAPDGKTFAALPPVQVEAPTEVPRLAPGFPVVERPLFEAHGFAIAPFYRPMFPSLEPYRSPFAVDPAYYDRWFRTLEDEDLPTPEMQARGLPEGVLTPTGAVTAWVYFEHVNPEAHPKVTFRADLVDAITGETMGTVVIPMVVHEEEAPPTEGPEEP